MELSEAAKYTSYLRRLLANGSRAAQQQHFSAPLDAVTPGLAFRTSGDAVVLLRPRAHAAEEGATLADCLREAISGGLLSSAHPGSILALALAESCRAGKTGALLSFDALAAADPEADLFQPFAAQALLSLAKENLAALAEIAGSKGLSLFYLGMVGGDHLILSDCRQTLIAIPLKEMQKQHVQEDS